MAEEIKGYSLSLFGKGTNFIYKDDTIHIYSPLKMPHFLICCASYNTLKITSSKTLKCVDLTLKNENKAISTCISLTKSNLIF